MIDARKMDRKFASIKSSSVLPSTMKPLKSVNPKGLSLKKPLISSRLLSNAKSNNPRLPPINVSMEISGFSPGSKEKVFKGNTSRRTLSNHLFLNENRNCVSFFSVKTKTGCSMGSVKPFNQDTFIINTSVLNVKHLNFFAVCDGHGTEGHLVSNLIKTNFLPCLEKHVLNASPEIALQKAVNDISEKVLFSKIDTLFSGSTFVGVLLQGDNLYCANVGDSGAVLGSFNAGWKSRKLSFEHKPNREDEANRILSKGGRISSHLQGGPLRIWYQDENAPGLAMTRSIGDKASREIGLISEAEIKTFKLHQMDKFLILASDGLWEFVSEQEAVSMVGDLVVQGKSEMSCMRLMREALQRWSLRSTSVDDITIVIVFLSVN
jgi:serine/threonine protein phosphatase PrpC